LGQKDLYEWCSNWIQSQDKYQVQVR
jgi:hypothetical protein